MKLFLLQALNKLLFYIFFPFTITGLIIEFILIPFVWCKDTIDARYSNKYRKTYKDKRCSLFLLWGAKNLASLIFFPITFITFILIHLSQPFIDFKDIIELYCCIEVRKKWEDKQHKGAVHE